MAQIEIPAFATSRRRTRTFDFSNDPTGAINAIAELICPAGSIVPSLTNIEPNAGWKLCNGQSLSKAEFPRLYAMIGGAFGESGDTFALPDLRGRFPVGADSTTLLPFSMGGAAQITLLTDQMPAHTHAITDPGHSHGFTGAPHGHTITDPGHNHTAAALLAGNIGTGLATNDAQAGATGTATTGITVNDATATGTVETAATGVTAAETGGGQPVSILPPYIALYWMVRT